MALAIFVAAICLLLSTTAESKVDYCRMDTFNRTGPWMQFTKEISDREYAIETKFKSLHCCAKGYNSIEWYKDGKPYPWPASTSSLILYPESGNQTIYTQASQDTDAGSYSCRVRNESTTLEHHVELKVVDSSGYSGRPLATFRPTDQYVPLGDDARLFCEAFVGRIDLPDAHNEVVWLRNGTPLPSQYWHTVAREDSLILGSYLFIHNIRHDDLGQYVCRISNTGFQIIEMPVQLHELGETQTADTHRIPYSQMFLVIGLVILSIITVVTLYLRFAVPVRLFYKDKFGPREDNDGKDFDILVCYDEKDTEFALGVLIPMLENKLGYRCCSQLLKASAVNSKCCDEIYNTAERSRRLMVVLSPPVVNNNWTCAALMKVLRIFLQIHPNTICISLQALPKEGATVKNEYGETLQQLCRKAKVIMWQGISERARRNFWKTVRLELPAHHNTPATGSVILPASANRQQSSHITVIPPAKRAIRTNSHESLEVLV
ncbi:single Ig IL-1-related receptor-like [Schistocerca piceifrons]|uniref:single Ig IL-1-related receptor-like n=1 Tax=Schistocerca piceifrons TaxID=274613 RepID=UPI001F5EC715|nr:single Ig IL-1-related receptor-like [Schistocerca piceifrons]